MLLSVTCSSTIRTQGHRAAYQFQLLCECASRACNTYVAPFVKCNVVTISAAIYTHVHVVSVLKRIHCHAKCLVCISSHFNLIQVINIVLYKVVQI